MSVLFYLCPASSEAGLGEQWGWAVPIALIVASVTVAFFASYFETPRSWERGASAFGWLASAVISGAALFRILGVELPAESAPRCEPMAGEVASDSAEVVVSCPTASRPTRFDCLYLAVVTATTLGYGDVLPAYRARLVSILLAIIGIVALGLVVDMITDMKVKPQSSTGQGTPPDPSTVP